jgi:hypothetical protein
MRPRCLEACLLLQIKRSQARGPTRTDCLVFWFAPAVFCCADSHDRRKLMATPCPHCHRLKCPGGCRSSKCPKCGSSSHLTIGVCPKFQAEQRDSKCGRCGITGHDSSFCPSKPGWDGCFPLDSLVVAPEGPTTIGAIGVGDLVGYWDFENEVVGMTRVERVNPSAKPVALHCIALRCNDSVTCTSSQRLLDDSGAWARTGEMGSDLVLAGGFCVKGVQPADTLAEVCWLTVENAFGNYIVLTRSGNFVLAHGVDNHVVTHVPAARDRRLVMRDAIGRLSVLTKTTQALR